VLVTAWFLLLALKISSIDPARRQRSLYHPQAGQSNFKKPEPTLLAKYESNNAAKVVGRQFHFQ
jgi:hypothetical protein